MQEERNAKGHQMKLVAVLVVLTVAVPFLLLWRRRRGAELQPGPERRYSPPEGHREDRSGQGFGL